MTDILLNDDFELRIENGDLVLDAADAQNQQLIIKADKGNFLESPALGVGIDRFLNGDLESYLVKLKKDIRVNFQLDGYELLTLEADATGINFTATTR